MKRIGHVAAAALLLSVLASVEVSAEEPTRQELLQRLEQLETKASRVDDLEARLAELETQRGATWMDERRAEQVKELVREVLADADTRASLLDNGILAGHDGKHFFLRGPDEVFTMEIGGQLQFRYIANWRDGLADDTDDHEAGFQFRRAKVYFSGTVITPRLHYDIQLAASRDKQSVATDKLVIGFDLTDSLYLWAGEDKGPFLREEMISSKRQLAVDRSLVNEAFTLDKVQGIGLTWKPHERVTVRGMVHDGLRSGEAPGDDWLGDEWEGFRESDSKDFNDDAVDYALVGRVDVLLAGKWKAWKDFTAAVDQELFAYIGAAIDYEHGESGDSSDDDNWLTWTVDGAIEYRGLSLYVAYVGASTDFEDGTGIDYQPWGLVVQGAYNFSLGESNGTLEPFARYEHLDIDDLGGALMTDYNSSVDLLTLGVNWYIAGHNSKLTADMVIAFDSLHDQMPGVSDGIGLLHDDDDQDNQVSLRVQYQLLF
jgi:hypothetical protein